MLEVKLNSPGQCLITDLDEFIRRKDGQNSELAVILERLQVLKCKISGQDDRYGNEGIENEKSGLLGKFSENANRTDSIISELYSVTDALQKFI